MIISQIVVNIKFCLIKNKKNNLNFKNYSLIQKIRKL